MYITCDDTVLYNVETCSDISIIKIQQMEIGQELRITWSDQDPPFMSALVVSRSEGCIIGDISEPSMTILRRLR